MLVKYERLENFPTKLVGLGILQRLGIDTLETEVVCGNDEKYCYENRLYSQINGFKSTNGIEKIDNNILEELFSITREETIEMCWNNLERELFTDIELKIIIVYIRNNLELDLIQEKSIDNIIKKLESIITRQMVTKNQIILCVDFLIQICQYFFMHKKKEKALGVLENVQKYILKRDIHYLKLDMYIKCYRYNYCEEKKSFNAIEIREIMKEIENARI